MTLHAAGASWGATRAKVVAQAKILQRSSVPVGGHLRLGIRLLGVHLLRLPAYGVTLARDADRQAVHGSSVGQASLLPGDLVFYEAATTGAISHVGMYVGRREHD